MATVMNITGNSSIKSGTVILDVRGAPVAGWEALVEGALDREGVEYVPRFAASQRGPVINLLFPPGASDDAVEAQVTDVAVKLEVVLERARRARAAMALLKLEETEDQLKAARSQLKALQKRIEALAKAGKDVGDLLLVSKSLAAIVSNLMALSSTPT